MAPPAACSPSGPSSRLLGSPASAPGFAFWLPPFFGEGGAVVGFSMLSSTLVLNFSLSTPSLRLRGSWIRSRIPAMLPWTQHVPYNTSFTENKNCHHASCSLPRTQHPALPPGPSRGAVCLRLWGGGPSCGWRSLRWAAIRRAGPPVLTEGAVTAIASPHLPFSRGFATLARAPRRTRQQIGEEEPGVRAAGPGCFSLRPAAPRHTQ